MVIERLLSGSKTVNKLRLSDSCSAPLPKQYCRHFLLGICRNSSLSDVQLSFSPESWYCPDDGRLVKMSDTDCVTQLDVVYSV